MKRRARLYLLALLLLVLPIVGMAGGVAPTHCAMQDGMQMTPTTACSHCHPGVARHAQHGQPCQDCGHCLSNAAPFPTTIVAISPVPLAIPADKHTTPFFQSHDPSGLWRPPTSL